MNNFIIRKANINDAEELTEFVIQLDKESDFLLYGPNERKATKESTENFLKKMEHLNSKSFIFIAENENNQIVGFLCGEANNIKRTSHVIKLNIGVLKVARGTKVARALAFKTMKYVQNFKLLRLEVTVIKDNKLSLNLCKKFGFEIEGLKKSSIKINDNFHDEYLLARLL